MALRDLKGVLATLDLPARHEARHAIPEVADDGTLSPRVGLMARALVQTTIPHAEPEALYFQRRNGNLRLTMVGHPDHGLPYGKTPRLFLAWMTRKARDSGSRRIELPRSQAALLNDLGMRGTGGKNGSLRNFREQALRLMKCTVHIDREIHGFAEWQPYQLSSGVHLWWEQSESTERDCWIDLATSFYEEIVTAAIPVDFNVLMGLRSPLAIDVYAWATGRVYRLCSPVHISWESLQMQFGGNYARTRDFRRAFVGALKQVRRYWPGLKINAQQQGIRLLPGPPHIQPIRRK